LKEGPMNTVDLRPAAKLGNAKESEFARGLEHLQTDFKILPVGVAEAGAWKYSFIYEVVARYYPELPENARKITEAEARMKLLSLYFRSVGAAQVRDALKLFGWNTELLARALRRLVEDGKLVEASHPSHKGVWFVLPKLTTSKY
jgi:hypothetical protein